MSSTSARSVLLLIADDWSPIAGCFGNNVIQTPNIDALAKRGVVFDNAFCTTPSCAASRASLLTGRHSHQHGQYGHSHDIHGFRTHPWIKSLPAVLRDSGMKSGLLGKAHILPKEVYPFDLWNEGDLAGINVMRQRALDFYKSIGDEPSYLHIASTYPHRGPGPTGYNLTACPDEFFNDVDYSVDDVVVPDFLPDLPEVREDLANYYKAVTRYDQFIGGMLDMLEKSGRADSTLVVVMTDHAMPYPGAKASSFDTGHNCPLIVADPSGKGAGTRCDALVNWLDIAPTVYDWMGTTDKAPKDLTGRSLLPIMGEASPAGWDETILAHNFHEIRNYNPYRILRERKYKYVRNFSAGLPHVFPTDLFRSATWQAVLENNLNVMGKRPVELVTSPPAEALFDIENDPTETRNLIDDPAQADTVKRMRDRLTEFRIQTCDPWLEVDFQNGDITEQQLASRPHRQVDA